MALAVSAKRTLTCKFRNMEQSETKTKAIYIVAPELQENARTAISNCSEAQPVSNQVKVCSVLSQSSFLLRNCNRTVGTINSSRTALRRDEVLKQLVADAHDRTLRCRAGTGRSTTPRRSEKILNRVRLHHLVQVRDLRLRHRVHSLEPRMLCTRRHRIEPSSLIFFMPSDRRSGPRRSIPRRGPKRSAARTSSRGTPSLGAVGDVAAARNRWAPGLVGQADEVLAHVGDRR
jgi:hypothetical protein